MNNLRRVIIVFTLITAMILIISCEEESTKPDENVVENYSGVIAPDEPVTVDYQDISIYFDEGTFEEELDIEIEICETIDHDFAEFESVGAFYNIIHDEVNFLKPIELKFDFVPENGIDGDEVFLARYSDDSWTKLDTQFDGDNNQLITTTSKLCIFGRFCGDDAKILTMNASPSPYSGVGLTYSCFENDINVSIQVEDEENEIESAQIAILPQGGYLSVLNSYCQDILKAANGYNLVLLPQEGINNTNFIILSMEKSGNEYSFSLKADDIGYFFLNYYCPNYFVFECSILDNEGHKLDEQNRVIHFNPERYPIINLVEPSGTAGISPCFSWQIDQNGSDLIEHYNKYKIVIDDNPDPFSAWWETYDNSGDIDCSNSFNANYEYTEEIDEELDLGDRYYWQVRLSTDNSFDETDSEVICSQIFSFVVEEESEYDYGDMIFVEGGSFQMGDHFNEGDGDELPVHEVIVSSFYISKYEVTQSEYKDLIGSTLNEEVGYFIGDNKPVFCPLWFQAAEYCNALSIRENLTPCYDLENLTYISCDFEASGYRLPTEAEWEYAARGGKNLSYSDHYSGSSNNLDDFASYYGNSNYSLDDVGSKSPNRLGIYDMSGSVYELCHDWYSADYYQTCYNQGTVSDPKGPGFSIGSINAYRGGGFTSSADDCRLSNRETYGGDTVFAGLRLIRTAQ